MSKFVMCIDNKGCKRLLKLRVVYKVEEKGKFFEIALDNGIYRLFGRKRFVDIQIAEEAEKYFVTEEKA